jgi:hypothetical protein
VQIKRPPKVIPWGALFVLVYSSESSRVILSGELIMHLVQPAELSWSEIIGIRVPQAHLCQLNSTLDITGSEVERHPSQGRG